MSACKIVILGAGLHAGVVIETLRLQGMESPVGILDDHPAKQGLNLDGIPVIGTLTQLPTLFKEGRVTAAVLGIGNIRLRARTADIYRQAKRIGLQMVSVVHPAAFVSPSAELRGGAFVGPGVIVHAHSTLGENVVVYCGTTIDHDNVIGDHVFFGPGVHTAGEVQIGAGAYLGPGAVIGSGCRVGTGSIVGAGAVVLKDVPPGWLVAGAPARNLKPVAVWEQERD